MQLSVPMLEALGQDLRYAVRMLGKSPTLTCVVTLSLALGIGANTALFGLVDGLLLRSLPVREPDRLVQVQLVGSGPIRKPFAFFPRSTFDQVRTDNPVLSEIVGFAALDRPIVAIRGNVEPPWQVAQVSEDFFRGLGVTPIAGRGPEPGDDAVGVLSYRQWRDRFGGDSSVLGQPVTVNGQTFSIVGIAPPRFVGLSIDSSPALWIFTRTAAPQQMIARLQPGVTPAQAQAALQGSFPRPDGVPPMDVELVPAGKGLSQLREQYRRPLVALTALVTVVLLMTCMNVGSLLMVRNTSRQREMSMRAALGARRSRLVQQYLVECTLLAALGGIAALAVARWGVAIILSMLPLPAAPESLAFHADWRILGFAAGVSLLSAMLFGLAPAWRASQVEITDVLKTSSRGMTPRTTRRIGRSLVMCQVALSVLLLVGAGLFVRSLQNLTHVDTGFEAERLLQVLMDPRGSGYGRGDMSGLRSLVLERVSPIPEIRSLTYMRNPLMRGGLAMCRMDIPGVTLDDEETWDCTEVGPSFFETMNIRVVRGRTATADDFANGRPYVVISESFAKRYFPNEDPIGKRLRDARRDLEIIGVVRNTKMGAVRRESRPMTYFMVPQEPDRFDVLQVRVAGHADTAAQAIARAVRGINPRLLIEVSPVPLVIERSIATERLVAATSAFFSLLGLLLASIGIFGIASYTVAQRTNELGIRLALGAHRWSVIRESLRDTLQVVAIGLAAGLAAAIAAVRLSTSFISELLFGITASDSANIAIALLLMLLVALTACILPARRATRIDPLTAIRYE